MTLTQFVQNLSKLNIEKITLDAVALNEERAISLNVDDQLYDKGIRADGKAVGEYSPWTKGVKQAKGQRYDHITLRDTSNFHDSFFLNATKWPVLFDARDWKTAKLKEDYGDDIFGLTKENTDTFGQGLIPEITEGIRKSLGI
jgi:hypothetical protein